MTKEEAIAKLAENLKITTDEVRACVPDFPEMCAPYGVTGTTFRYHVRVPGPLRPVTIRLRPGFFEGDQSDDPERDPSRH